MKKDIALNFRLVFIFIFIGATLTAGRMIVAKADSQPGEIQMSRGHSLQLLGGSIWTVTKIADTNDGSCNSDCSLREAIAGATNGDVITFSSTVFSTPQTITLSNSFGQLLITKSVTITGTGARKLTIQRSSAAGTPNFRIIETTGSTTVVDIFDLTIRGGNPASSGGGIQIGSGSTVRLRRITLRDNTGTFGGGINNNGNLQILDSTISNNVATIEGGGLRLSSGTANIANSTIAANTSFNNGGGVLNFGLLTLNNVTIAANTGNTGAGMWNAGSTLVNIRNTLIAANISGNGDPRLDAHGAFVSYGSNLIGVNTGTGFVNGVNGDIVGTSSSPVDPRLDSLGEHNGPTDTLPLLYDSPAIHRGSNCVVDQSCNGPNAPAALLYDQRGVGFFRQRGSNVDIGAYEYPNYLPVITSITPESWGAGGPGFEITLTGLTFVQQSRVRWNGQDRPTTYVSDSELRAQIPASDVTSASIAAVTVVNPILEGGTSPAKNLTIANCTFVDPTIPVTIAAGAGHVSLGMTTTPAGGCPLTASTNANWLTNIVISGVQLSFDILANTGPERNGTITVNAPSGSPAVINVRQFSGCTYQLLPSSRSISSPGISSNFTITAGVGCQWQAQSNAAWITVNFGGTGSGNGNVFFTVAPNTGVRRLGSITAAGQTFLIEQAPGSRTVCDFDGDEKTDLSIVRPSNYSWWHQRSSDSTARATQFGAANDVPVPADFTGDGKTDIAFYRPSNGQWFVLRSEDSSFFSFGFGTTGDIPIPGDRDGDGKADAAVFRPSIGTWFIQKSGGGTDIIQFGSANDKPLSADFDGDAKMDLGIFRPGGVGGAEWWILRSAQGNAIAMQFGASTDRPVVGDYTGDGRADVAFYRPSIGNWFVRRSEDFSYYAFGFGTTGDVPAPGDYDGDAKADPAVFRPSNGTWYILRSTGTLGIVQFGSSGDTALPGVLNR